MPTCPFCGKPVPPDWKYCGHCGRELPAEILTGASTTHGGPPHRSTRSASITIASVFLSIFGILWLIGGIALLSLGETRWLGVVVLLLSFLYLETGRRLWGSERSGGTLGLVICASGIVLSVVAAFLLTITIIGILLLPLAAFCIVVNIILIILIALGWNSLG